MRLRDIDRFVEGTSDPAYAVDGLGFIVAWNPASEEMFEISATEAVGRQCCEVIVGTNEDGVVCSNECIILQSANNNRPMRNFDLRINTPKGEEWFNVSLIVVDVVTAVHPRSIHILRSTDVYKRLELIIRDFVVGETDISAENIKSVVSSARYMVRELCLTKRQLEVLRLVAKGGTSATIAKELDISPTTVDNHLQNTLKRLNVHSRLEAVLCAEHAGLL